LCAEVLGHSSTKYKVVQIDLTPDGAEQNFTRGTGSQTIDSKYAVDTVPVQSNSAPTFTQLQGLNYRALLYEVRELDGVTPASISPNWFGVAIPNPQSFDISGDVYTVLYFHPETRQAGYSNVDYPTKGSAHGTDWKQLYAYADRLGGQMAAAVEHYSAPANRLAIMPFLAQSDSVQVAYTLQTSEWGNILHDILQDINANIVTGICTRPKKVVVAALSNGSIYSNQFLTESSSNASHGVDSIFSNIVEVWDFDSEVTTNPTVLVNPVGLPLRAYWQRTTGPSGSVFTALPASSWTHFQNPPPSEIPPLPPNASNSNSPSDAANSVNLFHHYIRDTMFLDAAWKLANPNA
jgi:hypothetical protein